jgi:quercetin dioxygenase-like cupin family protein
MKVQNIAEVPETAVTMDGAKNAKMRLLVSDKDGAPNFAMRMFSVAPGGHTPFHFHNYEHEVFVLEGDGLLKAEDKSHRLRAGDAVFVAPNEKHQFQNVGMSDLKFICLIPNPERCA